MNKRLSILFLIVLLLLVFVGCEQRYTPDPEVEAFLNTGNIDAIYASSAVKLVEYSVTETQFNKAGEQLGKYIFDVVIDKSDDNNLKLEIEQSFSGSYVQNGISRKHIKLSRIDGKYIFVTTIMNDSTSEEVEEQFVVDYIASFFYTNNNAYNEGGLYYGDFFLLYIFKYPPTSFSVDKENELCVFNEKMDIHNNSIGNVHLHQISKINKLGLLVSNYERYESVEADVVLTSELTATYTYF